MVGDSFSDCVGNSLGALHAECNLTTKFKHIRELGTPYISVKCKNPVCPKMGDFHQKFKDHLVENKPTTTLFFMGTITQKTFDYRQQSGISMRSNRKDWETMVKEAYEELLPFVTQFTNPVFAIGKLQSDGLEQKCRKSVALKYKNTNWLDHMDECVIHFQPDSGHGYLRQLLKDFQNTYPTIRFFEMHSLFFGANTTTHPSVYEGTVIFPHDGGHFGDDFCSKKLPVIIDKILSMQKPSN